MELYTQILDHGGPTIGFILRHIVDKPTEGCLFHCTAGKDRTGVIAAIILEVQYHIAVIMIPLLIVFLDS